jgi:Ca2+-binding RTX toxin-like protein
MLLLPSRPIPLASRRRRLLALTAVGAAALGTLPAAASAGTVTTEGGVLVFRAAPGETNDLYLNDEGGEIVLSDSVPMTSADGTCSRAGSDPVERLRCVPQSHGVRAELGDGNDVSRLGSDWTLGTPITLDGGAGNDQLDGYQGPESMLGGDGDDTLEGNLGDDHLFGDAGNDTVDGGDDADEVRGGDGDDVVAGGGRPAFDDIVDGGAGRDTLSQYEYSGQQSDGTPQPVRITLAGGADDGRPGENDNISGVEVAHLLVAADITAAGDPVDLSVFRTQAAASRLVGSPGPDLLTGFDFDDVIEAGAGDDQVIGSYGNDTINPGAGRDTVNADTATACNFFECRPPYGNDTVDARDGEVDQITCGVGEDRVLADAADVVAADCETVQRASAPDAGKPGDGGKGPQGGDAPKPAKKLGVTLPKKLRAKAVRSGTRLAVVAPKAGKVTLKLTKGSGRARRTVATGAATAKAPGTVKVRLKALKAQRSRVRRGTFRLSVTLRPAKGKATTLTRTVKLR